MIRQAEWSSSWNQHCQEKYQQPQICKWYHSNGRKGRGTKELLDESERWEWKGWFIIQHSKKLRLWYPVPSFHRWGKVEAVIDFLFLGSKMTVDSDCSHKTKRRLLLGRKDMTKFDSVLKSRDITLPTKVHIVKVLPVVTYGCESWTIKKAERWRTVVLEKTWTARRSNQSILKEINPEYSLKGLMLKSSNDFGHPCEK